MTTLLDSARHDAIRLLASELVSMAADNIKRHGPDPQAAAVVGAGFVEAIVRINAEIQPGFTEGIIKALGGQMLPCPR